MIENNPEIKQWMVSLAAASLARMQIKKTFTKLQIYVCMFGNDLYQEPKMFYLCIANMQYHITKIYPPNPGIVRNNQRLFTLHENRVLCHQKSDQE